MLPILGGMKRPAPDAGFTLVELLVTMLVIGVLCAIAIPVFLVQRHKAADSAAKSDLSNIALMARSVELSNGAYPTTYVEAAEPPAADPATVYYKRSPGVSPVQSITLPGGALCLQVTSSSGAVLSWTSTDGLRPTGTGCPGL
jgi:prepilin-type N-terminal cleavage/methylation domain-containing protein